MQKLLPTIKSELISRKVYIEVLLLLYIVLPITTLFSASMSALDYSSFEPGSLSLFVFACAGLMTLLLCVSLFSECSDQSCADIAYALPVSSKDRYLSKLMIVALFVLVPFLVSMLLTLAIAELSKLIEGYKTPVVLTIGMYTLLGLAGLICTATVSFVCSVCCTTKAAAYFTSVMGMLVLTYLPFLFFLTLYSTAGVYNNDAVTRLLSFSGFGGAMLFELSYGSSTLPTAVTAVWALGCVINILLSLIMFIIGLKLYRARNATPSSRSTVFRPFMFVFLTLMTLTLFLLLSETGNTLTVIVLIIMSAVLFSAVTYIPGKGIRYVFKSILTCITAGVVLTGIYSACYFTEGFGISKVPPLYSSYNYTEIEICTDIYDLELKNISSEQLETVTDILKQYDTYSPSLRSLLLFRERRGNIYVYVNGCTSQNITETSLTSYYYNIPYDKQAEALEKIQAII